MQVVGGVVELDVVVLGFVIFVDYVDVFVVLVGQYGFVIDQYGLELVVVEQLYVGEQVWCELVVGVVQQCMDVDGVGVVGYLVVEEVDFVCVWVVFFIGQVDFYWQCVVMFVWVFVFVCYLGVVQEGVFVGIEVDEYGVQ